MAWRKTVFTGTIVICAGILAGIASPAVAQQSDDYGSPELIAAARKEGRITIYTVQDPDSIRGFVKAFNQRFPFVNVSILRLPGGQLITRVKTEWSAGKLGADVIELSDPDIAEELAYVFTDYAPPAAKDYMPQLKSSTKLWNTGSAPFCLGYNSALVKEPLTSWGDLAKPEFKGRLGVVTVLTGGSGWLRAAFERKFMGKDYWPALAKNQPKIYPSGVPLMDAMVRGEIAVGAVLMNQFTSAKDTGAPVECVFGKEGIPVNPLKGRGGITKTSAAPNAAKLFMNWSLSLEGQTYVVEKMARVSGLTTAPRLPGVTAAMSLWEPQDEEEKQKAAWIAEWSTVFNYRQ